MNGIKPDKKVPRGDIIGTMGGVISEDYADPCGQERIVILESA